MAQPSSIHERTHRSSSHHHHHRTISSTTLLLALSLILAVLAITLTIPSYSNPSSANVDPPVGGRGVLDYFNPRRAQGIVSRESQVAAREAEVARREAELLIGSPAGVAVPAPPATLVAGCPTFPTIAVATQTITQTVTIEVIPTSTVVKEVVKEIEAIGGPPVQQVWYKDPRSENVHEREQRVAEREKDVGLREETVSKREGDASRRESWIMEQLMNLGNKEFDKYVEEEVVYEAPPSSNRRKPKASSPDYYEDTPLSQAKTEYLTRTVTNFEPHATILDPILIPTHTVTTTVAMPSATRLAAHPAPEVFLDVPQPRVGRTREVEILADETLAVPIATRMPHPEVTYLDDYARPVHGQQYREEEARPVRRSQDTRDYHPEPADDYEDEEEDDSADPQDGRVRIHRKRVRIPHPPGSAKKRW